MSTVIRRFRSSSSVSTTPTASTASTASKASQVLHALLKDLTLALCSTDSRFPAIPVVMRPLGQIRQHLEAISSPNQAQDDFRCLDGFQTLLNVLRTFSSFYEPRKRDFDHAKTIFDLIDSLLAVCSAAFHHHPGNKRYFKYRVEGGGWEGLEQALASIGFGGDGTRPRAYCTLFSTLLSFAVREQSLEPICRPVLERLIAAEKNGHCGDESEHVGTIDTTPIQDVEENDFDRILVKAIGDQTVIQHPEILRAVVGFWESIPRQTQIADSNSLMVLSILCRLVEVSTLNRAALHSMGALSRLIRVAFRPSPRIAASEFEKVLLLCRLLLPLGMDEPADTQFLVSSTIPGTLDLCLRMASEFNSPPSFLFDLSLHGFSSIELANLGGTFPPPSGSGYTFTAWIYVDRFDPSAHTTLFGVYDSTQTCFLLVYLEMDTRNFILQTSVTASRPSVRFKAAKFAEKKWYHVALVHRRPKPLVASKASLYIDGQLIETLRCNYPIPPPVSTGSTESFASITSSSGRSAPVQAFLGTPKDLSSHVGPGLVHSAWSLASAHLIDDVLSDDFLAVHYGLGPRYQGNFQDSLGSFQTYEASACLGLRNEAKNLGKDKQSEIIRAIREKAGTLLPESRLILSIYPEAVFRADVHFQRSGLLRGLPAAATKQLREIAHRTESPWAVNAAIPYLPDALVRTNGLALLTGDPIVCIPANFDSNLWRLAGFTSIALRLVEKAASAKETILAVEIVFKSIRNSWRNSEAMERDSAYGILGMLLRLKLGFLSCSQGIEVEPVRLSDPAEDRAQTGLKLLRLVLDFVGYNHLLPSESFIVNQLAYRILLIDLDIWRKMGPAVQELYYNQFVTFGALSKHHLFNSRRLQRMRCAKRLLDSFKVESLSEDLLPHFTDAFMSLVKFNCSKEVMRHLVLFITYALHSSTSSLPPTSRSCPAISTPSTPVSSGRPTLDLNASTDTATAKYLTRKEIGIKILSILLDLLCERGNRILICKFAETVTNRWLLYLLTEDDAETVVLGFKILARVLVLHGSAYVAKFAETSRGFYIIAQRLKRWWDIPTLWPISFSILFGVDVADVAFDRNFSFFSLVELFAAHKVVYGEALVLITSMLQHGLRDVLKNQANPDSPSQVPEKATRSLFATQPKLRPRPSSMELSSALESRNLTTEGSDRVEPNTGTIQTVSRFLSDLLSRSADFRDFALSSDFQRLILLALYPAIVSADPVSPETELNSQDMPLNFDGGDVIFRSIGSALHSTIVRTSVVDIASPQPQTHPRRTPLRKASSFILISPPYLSPDRRGMTKLQAAGAPGNKTVCTNSTKSQLIDDLLELVLNIFLDQLFVRKEFPGFGLHLTIPPGFQEHQAYFESFVLRNTISHVQNHIQLKQELICEPKILTNLARLHVHLTEAIFEGWFMGGTEPTIDLAGKLLEYLQRPDIAGKKSVRLCSQAISTIRGCFLKILLLRLSDVDDSGTSDAEAAEFMSKMMYWQMVILGSLTKEDNLMRLLYYQLHIKLMDRRVAIRTAAADLIRILLVQKPGESAALFRQFSSPSQGSPLAEQFNHVTEIDNVVFFEWVDSHRESLDSLFFGGMSGVAWEEFVFVENQRTTDAFAARVAKRKERLRQWQAESVQAEIALLKHEVANPAWTKQMFSAEQAKHQRLAQDQQDDLIFLARTYARLERELRRPGAAFGDSRPTRWSLDLTEGRNRMRLRLLPDYDSNPAEYQPKRKGHERQPVSGLSVNTAAKDSSYLQPAVVSPSFTVSAPETQRKSINGQESVSGPVGDEVDEFADAPDDDFEIVDGPNDPADGDPGFEDKNRKVIRQLERGDLVQAAYNISRIVGLEACEGICIVGKDALYIMDNVFQCATGEIVDVWDAPTEERDPFSQIVTDAKTSERRQHSGSKEQECRSWKWKDVIIISKRRFLFRDVAIEVFFADGRSYLLTAINPTTRDELFGKLLLKAPHTSANAAAGSLPLPEVAWRLEIAKVMVESPQGFGQRFGAIFNSSSWNPVLKRWQRGEVSNFHYLMMVNTMAGRTFNDLTQYPVFPWVLADYASDELDLDNPASFRDLSKPMGAQTAGRVTAFRESFKALAEIGETPFHYGTHYSSAMIVSSYLIRIPPFVQSYILLQGGHFDHADRLFHSIPVAWRSASQDNTTDVRELIPEFFCFPEFLRNINGYNFGTRQSDGVVVDHVELPPWAKGDPKIFIAKHREALESPFVSERLHQWIDLVFGSRQSGECAVESLNVFHHLSYRGATNLDDITDPKERAITAGVIHNFGQTPLQVFAKPHPPRECIRSATRRLDRSVFSLSALPEPLFEIAERVVLLVYAPKLDRLLGSSPLCLHFSPFDKFLQWGYADNSIRFFFSDGRKPAGLFENFHIGQISSVCFADSKTLITAGQDCVITVHSIQSLLGKAVEATLKSSLFGHRTPVSTMEVSKAFSTLLSVSEDGQAFLWDLNRLSFVRRLSLTRPVDCARINDVTGEIMLCCGPNLVLYTLNGGLMVDQKICTDDDDHVHSCAFYEGAANEWLEHSLVFTGHNRGRVNIWRKAVVGSRWALEFLRGLDHVDPRSAAGGNTTAAITCITVSPQSVCTGDEEGRVFEWSIPQRER